MFRLGLIINPLAGIGGRVALKGSDGIETVKAAQALGAKPQAQHRTRSALEQVLPFKDQMTIYTAANDMGESLCADMGFKVEVIEQNVKGGTTADDTETTVKNMIDKGVDVIMVAGGDGTARNVHHALSELDATQQPVIGIPAGCKIHSAVYAVTPKHAGDLLALIIRGRPLAVKEVEVMDIDEEAFRQDVVKAKLYGHLNAPAENQYMQNMKEGGVEHEEIILQDMAAFLVETMEDDTLYFIGSGTTPKAVLDELGLESTLLGVDVIENQQLVEKDITEEKILSLIDSGKPVKVIMTIIGGQGHWFGRGNQQFSPDVIKRIGKENFIVVATPEKLHALNGEAIHVDTGDEALNKNLCGMIQVLTGYDEHTFYRVE